MCLFSISHTFLGTVPEKKRWPRRTRRRRAFAPIVPVISSPTIGYATRALLSAAILRSALVSTIFSARSTNTSTPSARGAAHSRQDRQTHRRRARAARWAFVPGQDQDQGCRRQQQPLRGQGREAQEQGGVGASSRWVRLARSPVHEAHFGRGQGRPARHRGRSRALGEAHRAFGSEVERLSCASFFVCVYQWKM